MLDTEVLSRTPPRALDVVTPVGEVRFAVRVSGWDVPARPEHTWGLGSGARLCRWRHQSVRLDVLSGATAPEQPGITRETVVFRVLAREALSEFVVQAELGGAPEDVEAGEGAFTAKTADAVVSVGGPGVEELRRCSREGRHVPPYWSGELAGAVELDGARLTWQLPGVERGDYAELWVSVAWSAAGEDPGPAVAIDPARVLRELTQ
ncbi:hypothetical protein M8542_01850 [Amycolatopsis sp. OK19-0408]|uniref:Uncharacterized protein n=1 Tax=Amycolatopsis iheyensis TaxID=2945988 RepID=A0A9X2N6I1_9PSEU|nr:hypothetical protein [Amycolatopsis iheyensis]MCR6481548.1 hypothetical protein [Amycolatopsis iheyensis]